MRWGGKWGEKWGCPGIEDYRRLCEAYQWKQLDHAPNWAALCRMLVETFAEVDDKIRERVVERVGLDQAEGAELDQWGAAVNQPRWGATDDLYRRAIKAAARKIYSEGAPYDFFDIAELVNPDVLLTIQEIFPACVRLYFTGLTLAEQNVLFRIMKHTDDNPGVAGLAICLQFVEIDSNGVFEWSYLNDDLSLDPVDHHWDHTDHDIPSAAGWAYTVT